MAVQAVPEPGSESARVVALLASAQRNAGGDGPLVAIHGSFRALVFELVVSGASGGAVSLDVWVQQSMDGVNWDDLARFPAVSSGTAGEVHSAALPLRRPDAAPEQHLWTDGALAAGAIREQALARRFRAKWTISASASFTFQVLAHLVP